MSNTGQSYSSRTVLSSSDCLHVEYRTVLFLTDGPTVVGLPACRIQDSLIPHGRFYCRRTACMSNTGQSYSSRTVLLSSDCLHVEYRTVLFLTDGPIVVRLPACRIQDSLIPHGRSYRRRTACMSNTGQSYSSRTVLPSSDCLHVEYSTVLFLTDGPTVVGLPACRIQDSLIPHGRSYRRQTACMSNTGQSCSSRTVLLSSDCLHVEYRTVLFLTDGPTVVGLPACRIQDSLIPHGRTYRRRTACMSNTGQSYSSRTVLSSSDCLHVEYRTVLFLTDGPIVVRLPACRIQDSLIPHGRSYRRQTACMSNTGQSYSSRTVLSSSDCLHVEYRTVLFLTDGPINCDRHRHPTYIVNLTFANDTTDDHFSDIPEISTPSNVDDDGRSPDGTDIISDEFNCFYFKKRLAFNTS